MIQLNLRENGNSRFRFAEPSEALIETLIEATRGKHIILLIHGYNSSRDGAMESYETLARRMFVAGLTPYRYDAVVEVHWPSRTAPGFNFAERAARKTARLLVPVLARLEAASISMETHSLGAKIALDLLSDARAPRVRDLILTAPAVDGESIQCGEKYAFAIGRCERALVCFSGRDSVLRGIYRRFGSLLRNPFTLGDTALGCKGPDDPAKVSPNVTLCDGTHYIDRHSGWRDSDGLYAAWIRWLQREDSPWTN